MIHRPRRGKKRISNDPTRRASRQQAAKVSASRQQRQSKWVKAGEYERQTITLPPEQRKLIKQLAKENGVSMFDFYRWLIDQGLQHYEEGYRPEPESQVATGVKLSHWSSS